MRRLVALAVCLSLALGASCTAFRHESHDDAKRHVDLTFAEVVHLRQARDYFALRDRLLWYIAGVSVRSDHVQRIDV